MRSEWRLVLRTWFVDHPVRRAARHVTDDVSHVAGPRALSDAVVAEGVLNALSVWDSDALVDRERVS